MTRLLPCSALLFLCSVRPGLAQNIDYTWLNPNGGDFNNPALWTPFDLPPPPTLLGPGGSSDRVHFGQNVSPANRYTVTNVDGTNDQLLIHNDSLTLEIVDYETVSTGFANERSFIVGVDSGDTADVILTGGAGAELRTVHAYIGYDGAGTVTVDNLQWSNSSTLRVGRLSNGTLNIQNGADVSSFIGYIGSGIFSSGTVTVDGANSAWTNLAGLVVGLEGNGTLNIQNGATASNNNGFIGNLSGSIGTATVDGIDSTWSNTGILIVGNVGNGTLNIQNGGAVSNTDGFIGNSSNSNNKVTVRDRGSWMNTGNLYVGGSSVSASGRGTLNVQNGGTVEDVDTLKVWTQGTVNLSGGMLIAETIDHTEGGDFNWTDGTLHVQTFNGNLVNGGGTLVPGQSAGSTAIVGDYTQQAGATLEIEIGGPLVSTDYDIVNVTGNAFLGGELELALIEDYIPAPELTFTIFSADNLLNFFSNVTNNQRLDTSDDGGSFLVHYGPGSAFDPDLVVLSDFESALSADFDNDGDVDGRDFLLIQRSDPSQIPQWETEFGTGVGPLASSQAVPEPTSILLLIGGICLPMAGRHR